MADGFEQLTADHRQVADLFEQYASSGDDAIAHTICEELAVHSAIEEKALYPQLRRLVDGGDDLADNAEAEHASIATLVATVEQTPPADLRSVMEELQRSVEAHVGEEENELFPTMRDAGVDAEALGTALAEAKADAEQRVTRAG
jgi:hemerythrin superfamily protein